VLTRFASLAAGFLLAGLFAVAAQPAFAHPHIWVDASLAAQFGKDGMLSAIEESWTFDKAFSGWAVQGLDTNGDGQLSESELQPLADDYIKGLGSYDFYTFAGPANADNIGLAAAPHPTMSYANERLTMHFTLEPTSKIKSTADFQIELSDPEFYVSLTFVPEDAVVLKGAPSACTVSIKRPVELDPKLAAKLAAIPADVHTLPPDLAAAVSDVGNVVDIVCPGGVTTAAEAAAVLSKTKAPPLSAPPVETNALTPRNAFFAWVYERQIAFYKALTEAMQALKTGNRAFWMLGLLSFLYGVFHAAGPGHGKLVISSYLLASEQQLRRGLVLSFVAAMMQSTVAVGFIVVAALAFRLTSISMSSAANIMAIGSYALVALIGLWLMAARLFGLGHHHRRRVPRPPRRQAGREALKALRAEAGAGSGHGDRFALAYQALTHGRREDAETRASHRHAPHHDHDHGHDHAHAITPKDIGAKWTDAIPVVAAVGLRPCSGALIVLAFSLTQGLLVAGIVSTFLMGLGTAITVSLLATIAVLAKDVARRIGGPGNPWIGLALWWFELIGATAVFAFGTILLMANI
jgi:nickel/cobalt transporter (NicO) family protein